MSSSPQPQPMALRPDIHQLASRSEHHNFNIRKYALEHEHLHAYKKQSLRTKYSDTSKCRVSTEPVEEQKEVSGAFRRVMSKREPTDRRMYLTGSLRHGRDRGRDGDEHEGEDGELEQAERCRQLDRKNNKGPLKKRMVETWLNNILMESTTFEVIDESLGNAALKKFQIDQNSMLSRGIKPENIARIYQALFVHSIGFNNNIKELVNKNTQVMKNVWKVFSVLLEYCAQGKFETMIGVIEREKTIKVQQLREEVAKRQEIIERNDELNQTKNIEIFKQIKYLTQQNINLTNEKNILYEDYQKTQQAFNEQVALRLKFQNKINQLFGVHRELILKHQRLYEQHKRKLAQCAAETQKCSYLTQQNGELKLLVSELTSDNQRLTSSEKYSRELVAALKEDKSKLNSEYNVIKHQYEEERRLTKELNRRASQLEIEVKNLSEIVLLKDKSWKETHCEYQLSLEENNRLYNVINEQRKQVEDLLFEKKEYNNRILNLMADASFEKKKKQEFMRLYYDTDKKAKQLSQKIKILELQNKIHVRRVESVESDIKSNYENIQQMHAKNNQLEDELYYLRRFRDSLGDVIQEKDDTNQRYRIENQRLSNENVQLKTSLKQLEMHYKVLKAEHEAEKENNKNRSDRAQEERKMYESSDSEKTRQLLAAKNELDRVKLLLQDTILNLKNEKFQRHNLKANYEQILMIMEKKNINEKEMGREISELKDSVLRLSQQKSRLTLNLETEIAKKQRIQAELEQNRDQFTLYRHQRGPYVHPFIYEDLAERYRILTTKYQEQQIFLRIKVEQIKTNGQKYANQIILINKSHEEYLANYKKQKEKQIFQKESLLQYEKQINTNMKVRLDKLETLAEAYAKKIEQRTTSEKEKLYADLVEEKTKAIEKLCLQLKSESAKNEEIRKQIITKSQQYENELINIKQKYNEELEQKNDKISELSFENNFFQQEVKKLKTEIQQIEQKFQEKIKQSMQLYMQSYQPVQNKSQLQSANLISPFQDQNITIPEYSKPKRTITEQIEKKNPAVKKRNQFSRKLKLAYTYYKG